MEQACLSCMAYVLRELGDWDQVDELCAELIAPGVAPQETIVADGVLGSIHAWRGSGRAGRAAAGRCLETAAQLNVVSMECDSAAALAWLAAHEGDARCVPRSTAACSWRAGSAARTTTTRSGGCAGRRAGSRTPAPSARARLL